MVGPAGGDDSLWKTSDDETTSPSEENGSKGEPENTLGLTVLAHPEPGRVGDRARVAPELSRTAPAFESRDGASKPLADRYLSREPIAFVRDVYGGLAIDPSGSKNVIEANGTPLTQRTRFDLEDLRRGVVLCLRGRIVLLAHYMPVARPQTPTDDLGIVGGSAAIATVRRNITTAAEVDLPVLILGESGTGKELIARGIHDAGPRRDRPYEALNMGTLSATLAASELFGHRKGAFTGADRAHEGCFARAHLGTLFLDEVAETPMDTQALLLRALETGQVRPLGASEDRPVDVRLVAATDADLETLIEDGAFRRALLHRLGAFHIRVPPLRARREDIGPLVLHFARTQLHALGRENLIDDADPERPWLSAQVVARLARHDWPGNVRELRNVVRQLVVSSSDRPVIGEGVDLDGLLRRWVPSVPAATPPATDTTRASTPTPEAPARPKKEIAEDELIEALRQHAWRLAPTARALNVSRAALYRLIDRSTRIRKASEVPREEAAAALHAANGDVTRAAASLEVSPRALTLRLRALGLDT